MGGEQTSEYTKSTCASQLFCCLIDQAKNLADFSNRPNFILMIQHSRSGKGAGKTCHFFFQFTLQLYINFQSVYVIYLKSFDINNVFKTHLTLCKINVGFRSAS